MFFPVVRVRRLAALAALALGLAVVAYGLVLNARISRRLGNDPAHGRSRFFATPLRIAPGMDIDRIGLLDHLRRLQYRNDGALGAPGTWRRRDGALEIRLRAFADPIASLPERLARIELDGARVREVRDIPTDARRTQATLEPVPLDVTWNGAWERREAVGLTVLPSHVRDAILAAEDARFYRHGAVDLRGIGRALVVNLRARRVAEGASTITQQLARTFFLSPERTWRRKIQEAVIAGLLELRLSKDEILELYVNEVYLGRAGGTNVVGVGEAARTFFGKRAEQLSVAEAATIAGIIRGPNVNSPLRNPERARERRNAVLHRMVRHGFLPPERAAEAKRAALAVSSGPASGPEALFFLEQVRRDVEGRFGSDALLERRLDVYTTLDPAMQRDAERGVTQGLAALERAHRWLRGRKTPLQGALVVVDTDDGAVRALVGGRDFAGHPFDRAASARRQAGSTFKPFVYLAAFTMAPESVTPSTLLDDTPFALRVGDEVWRPVDYDERFRGRVTVRTALESSLNVPTVRLSQLVGVDGVARIAAAAGWQGDVPRVPAAALGVGETSLVDLAGAYTVFPNLGAPVRPYLVRGVADGRGAALFRHDAVHRQTTDARAAYLVHHVLEGVVDRGTARGLRRLGIGGPLAGKTGTTDDYRDAWFVGYTPELLGAAWVGFDDGRPLRLPAATTALDVWASAMRPILQTQRQEEFAVPSGIVFRDVDPASGLLPDSACPQTIREAFRAGTEPTARCGARPDLVRSRPSEDPLEAPARAVRDWLQGAMRIFGGPTRPRFRAQQQDDEARRQLRRRRYPAEIDEEAARLR